MVVNQRQLAYVIINSLLGNKLQGIDTGISAGGLSSYLHVTNNLEAGMVSKIDLVL